MKWTYEENKLLKRFYTLKSKEELLDIFKNRTYDSIKLKANKLNLHKIRNEYCNSNCDILLEEQHETYYWTGFILADGHISKSNRLRITLAAKDANHLIKFCNYIQTENFNFDKEKNNISVAVKDNYILSKYKIKFDIDNNKTKNPPKIGCYSSIEDSFFMDLFCGFIDGDGSIKKVSGKRRDCNIAFHIDSSWLEWMTFCAQRVSKIFNIDMPLPKICKDGYLAWVISNNTIINKIKQHAKNMELPILDRKWDKIDDDFISRYVITENKFGCFCDLYGKFNQKYILKKLKIAQLTYKKFEKRLEKKNEI